VRRYLAADRHRRGAGADRADRDRRIPASRLDQQVQDDVDHSDHDVLVVQRRLLVRVGFIGS
jgi:hypothetical protein